MADGSVEDARIAFADAAARRPSLVVVAGGDGTVRQAAAALGGTGDPAGHRARAGPATSWPAGLRLGGPAAMARALPTAVERVVDLGQVTWGADPGSLLGVETFVVACGMGLDARIMDGTEPHLKRRFSFAAYMASAAREILRPRPSRFLVDVDGDVTELTGLAVLMANAGELIPGLLGPRQAIDPCDGRLEVLVLGGRERARGGPRRPRAAASDGRPARRGRAPPLGADDPRPGRTGPAHPDRRRRPRSAAGWTPASSPAP